MAYPAKAAPAYPNMRIGNAAAAAALRTSRRPITARWFHKLHRPRTTADTTAAPPKITAQNKRTTPIPTRHRLHARASALTLMNGGGCATRREGVALRRYEQGLIGSFFGVADTTYRRCRCANATPDPDFRYRSKASARRSSANSMMTSIDHVPYLA